MSTKKYYFTPVLESMNNEIKNSLIAVDFFCGAGGVTCGFRSAGIDVIAGIDIDNNCKETYEKNNAGAKFLHADIAKLQPETLQKKFAIYQNSDNLILIGCSPCQYYTLINTVKEKSAKGKMLLDEFKRFVEYFKPGYVFIENVPGIDKKTESPLSKFKTMLSDMGYIFDEAIINATDYHVPQSRKRYVLMATRLHTSIKVPPPVGKKISVKDTIADFPKITAGCEDKTKVQHWSAKLKEINIKRLQKTPSDGGTRMAWKDDDELQLKCYRGKDGNFKDVYGRLFWDLPAPTITTKFVSISNGRFAHPEQNRGLSLREGACLQSFPIGYIFHSNSIAKIAKMIGNAVPPNMAKEIGKALLKNYHDGTI